MICTMGRLVFLDEGLLTLPVLGEAVELSTGTWTCHSLPVLGEHLYSVLCVTCGGVACTS